MLHNRIGTIGKNPQSIFFIEKHKKNRLNKSHLYKWQTTCQVLEFRVSGTITALSLAPE